MPTKSKRSRPLQRPVSAPASRSLAICSPCALVRLVNNQIPPDFQDLTWTQIVGHPRRGGADPSAGELAAPPEVEFVEAGRQMSPSLDTSVAETRADRVRNPPPAVGLDGSGW